MPTTDELAAWLAGLDARVAVLEGKPPTPPPPGQAPAVPTGLAVELDGKRRPVLTWDADPAATEWDVRDELNLEHPVQETVHEPRSVRSPLKTGQHRRYSVAARNTAGESSPCGPVDVSADPSTPPGPSSEPTPDPALNGDVRYPADLVGKGWYLTLPTGQQASPDTIHQPALATYTSRFFELNPAKGGIVFRAWHGGVTTKGSPNPRSELRECTPDGSQLAKWSAAEGRHSMSVEGQVNRLTKVRPHVVIGQIHGASDDVTVFRVEGDKLWITNGDEPHGYLLDPAFTLGKRYSIGFDVADGVISYRYNGETVPFTLKSSDPGCYFKAGAYLQSNPKSAPSESTDQYTEVIVYAAPVSHVG